MNREWPLRPFTNCWRPIWPARCWTSCCATVPIGVEVDGDRVHCVELSEVDYRRKIDIRAPYVLDATELGDLLPMAGVEHVIGSESQAQTGEPHACRANRIRSTSSPSPGALPWITCRRGFYHRTSRDYDFWRSYKADFWPEPQLGWVFVDPTTLDLRRQAIFEGPTDLDMEDLWHFRRIFLKATIRPETYASDITLVNWPQTITGWGPWSGFPTRSAATWKARAS
jgi:hypothetical protein